MPTRQILFDADAHAKIAKGVETIARAVGKTMGPRGRAVAIETKDPFRPPTFTVDGVTVANHVELPDPFERVAADSVRAASRKTNDIAGDGTTTAAVLAHSIYSEGRRRVLNGANPVAIKALIEEETKKAVEDLRAMAIPVADHNALERVATISAKDEVLGKLIAGVMRDTGDSGMVTVEAAPVQDVTTEVTRGFKLDSGQVQPAVVNNPQRSLTEFSDAHILVTSSFVDKDIANIMERLAKKGVRELVVIADDFAPEALAIFFDNAVKAKFHAIGVRATGLGDHRKKESLRDLCAAIGATLIAEDTGKTVKDALPELCGKGRQITVTKEMTLIVEGQGKQEDIDMRLKAIEGELAATASEYDKDKLKERRSRLLGVAGVIKVGGTNDADTRERKQRVEDAVNAVRAAKEEGVLPGGGTSLLNAGANLDILKKPLQEPLRRIAENAGFNPDVTLEKTMSLPPGEGMNVATGEWCDLVASGVIDPCKVTRVALENASAVAGLLLVTDVLIVEEEPKK